MDYVSNAYHVLWENSTYTVQIITNSTPAEFMFNQSGNMISFNITGLDYSQGFCNITIPLDLLSGTFNVILDTTPATYSLTQNSTHSSIYFEYSHSTHEVQIIATVVILEFSNIIVMMSILFVLTVLMMSIMQNCHTIYCLAS